MAFWLYFSRLLLYSLAIDGTSGSSGLGSVSREQMERSILVTVRAGDQAVFRISRHMPPCESMLG